MTEIKCPSCGKMTVYEGNEFRPFCTERCKMLDFGAWADEEFALPAQETELSEEDLHMIEKLSEQSSKL